MTDNLYNNTLYADTSMHLGNDTTERTEPITDIYISTISDVTSTNSSSSHSNSDTSSTFIELYSTTSTDSVYITKQQHETNHSMELQSTPSTDFDKQNSTVDSVINDYSINDINQSSTDRPTIKLDISTSEIPANITFNRFSTVNDMNEDTTITNSPASFTNVTENISVKFTDTGIAESYGLLSSTERAYNTFPNMKDITITTSANESLTNTFSAKHSSSTEPNLTENGSDTVYSDESNNLVVTNATSNVYDMREKTSANETNLTSATLGLQSSPNEEKTLSYVEYSTLNGTNLTSISNGTNLTSATLGLQSSSNEEKTSSYGEYSTLSEETSTNLNKIYRPTSNEPYVETNDVVHISTTVSPTTSNSFSRYSSEAVTIDSSATSFEETTISFSSLQPTSFTEIHNSTYNSTSVPSLDIELSSHVLNETVDPHSFEETEDDRSSTDIVLDTVKTDSNILSTVEPQVTLENTSDHTTLGDTEESLKTISIIDHTISEISSDRTISKFQQSNFNVTGSVDDFTASPFLVLLNSTIEDVTSSIDILGSYNGSKEQSTWSITDNDKNVTEQFSLTPSLVIFNITSSPDNEIMNLTKSDDSETSMSYSESTFSITETDDYSKEKLYNSTITDLTELSTSPVTTNISKFVTEDSISVFSASTSTFDKDTVTEFMSTTSRYSTEGETSIIPPSSGMSSLSTHSYQDNFPTTTERSTTLEINNFSTTSLFEATEKHSTTSSDGETFSLTSTIITPIEVVKKINKCLANITEMELENTVTIFFSHFKLQDEIWDDSYEIKFQQSALSCLDVQLHAMKNEKNEEMYSVVNVEDKKNEYVDPNVHSGRSIECVSPALTSKGEIYSIVFYVKQLINDTEKLIPASIIAQSLKSCKSIIEQDVGLNITDIFENIHQIATLPAKADICQESVLQCHASLFISLSLVFGLLLIFGTIAIVYFCCCSHSRRYDTEKKKLKQDMSASVEIGDMIPASEILNGEIGEKEIFGLANGSSSHLIKMDDDGWVVPFSEVPLEERNPPDVQDTKL